MLKVIAKLVNVKLEDAPIPAEQAYTKETKAKYLRLPALTLPGDIVIYETTAIARHLARSSPLYKSDNEANMALIDSWMSVLKDEGEKLCHEVILPILGHKEYTNRSYNEALSGFKAFLKNFNKIDTYLVGSSMTIADLYAASIFHYAFALILDEGIRKAFPKLAAWYQKVANEPAFVEFFGVPRFCKIALKPLLPPAEEAKAEKKPEKKAEKKPEKKPEEGEEDEEAAPKKVVNPLDQLKPSPFDLDAFKRAFLANKTPETRRAYIRENFWKMFDAEGWALWLFEYIKAEGEGEILYKTSNLLGGFLWVCDSGNPA